MPIAINREFHSINNFSPDFQNKIRFGVFPRAAFPYVTNRYFLAYKRRLATHRNYFHAIESDFEPR